MAKLLRGSRASRRSSSDLFHNTPNLEIDILRDQAAIYGVSETRIVTLLRNAYSQNYVYLIKKPHGPVPGHPRGRRLARAAPRGPGAALRPQSDDGKHLVPLSALVDLEDRSLGPQAVNHLNQFTSVTFNFNLMPGVSIGRRDRLHRRTAAARSCRPRCAASFQGEALTFRDTVRSLTILMVLAVFVMYVILAILYESYLHPITVLSTLPTALVGGLLTLLRSSASEASLYAFVGMFMLMGIVKKNGIMIVDFAHAARRPTARPPSRPSTTRAWTASARSS